MGWSFRIGRLAGIDIYVHYTFLILLGFIGLRDFLVNASLAAALFGLGLTAAVFGIIVLHELGHALAARYYGIPTKDITLLPIGGVARLQRMPDKPVQELVVALAGPAVNVVLAVFFGALLVAQAPLDPQNALTFGGSLLEIFFMINAGLVIFNLLPAFPMDGGRVLRALLAMRLGPSRATHVAARVGRGMAILFAIVGLFGIPGVLDPNLMLVVIALFVWTGADAEARAMRAKAGLAGVPVEAVMVRRFATVDPDDALGSVLGYAGQTFQRDFPVVVSGRLVGVLTREDLRAGLDEFGVNGRVFQVMRRDIPTIGPDDLAERGLALLGSGAPIVPVVERGQLAGLLTPEHLAEFVSFRDRHRDDQPDRTDIRSQV
jgi:Zn-dependent protease/CBS domain-containing protein